MTCGAVCHLTQEEGRKKKLSSNMMKNQERQKLYHVYENTNLLEIMF